MDDQSKTDEVMDNTLDEDYASRPEYNNPMMQEALDEAFDFFREVKAGERNGASFQDAVKYHRVKWANMLTKIAQLPDTQILEFIDQANAFLVLTDMKFLPDELFEEVESVREWFEEEDLVGLRDRPAPEPKAKVAKKVDPT